MDRKCSSSIPLDYTALFALRFCVPQSLSCSIASPNPMSTSVDKMTERENQGCWLLSRRSCTSLRSQRDSQASRSRVYRIVFAQTRDAEHTRKACSSVLAKIEQHQIGSYKCTLLCNHCLNQITNGKTTACRIIVYVFVVLWPFECDTFVFGRGKKEN